jgi:hypothetical protein
VRRAAALALARLPALPSALAQPVADAMARGGLDAAALDGLAGALERTVTAADRPALGRAYLAAGPRAARGALARALAAASAEAPLEDASVVAALLGDVAGGREGALGAAEALARARLGHGAEEQLVGLFARAEGPVRARLAPALAPFGAGAAALAGALADTHEAPSVRAAAAWALAGVGEARDALRAAAASPEPSVAANARAALAGASAAARRRRWCAVELLDGAGEAVAGRWVTVASAEGAPVWVLTDARGRARLLGLPEGALTLSLPPPP